MTNHGLACLPLLLFGSKLMDGGGSRSEFALLVHYNYNYVIVTDVHLSMEKLNVIVSVTFLLHVSWQNLVQFVNYYDFYLYLLLFDIVYWYRVYTCEKEDVIQYIIAGYLSLVTHRVWFMRLSTIVIPSEDLVLCITCYE